MKCIMTERNAYGWKMYARLRKSRWLVIENRSKDFPENNHDIHLSPDDVKALKKLLGVEGEK